MAKRGGTRNHFLKEGLDLRDHVIHQYGPLMPLVEKMHHEHLTRKQGCHQCAKDVQDRLLGKVPVTVRHTGGNRQPIILVTGGIGTPENIPISSGYLEEGAEEGEFEEMDEEDDEIAPTET